MEERFIIFDIQSQAPAPGDFGFGEAAAQPPEAIVAVADLTPAQAAAERKRPNRAIARTLPTTLIKPVAADEAAAEPAAGGTSWGVEAVGAVASPFTGSGIKLAVLDTGIDAAHPAFQGVNVVTNNFTDESDSDENGHGTHCAGTALGRDVDGLRIGVAPGVKTLIAGKVLGEQGGSTQGVVKGIQWALDNGANVISMSLGIDFPGAVDRFVQQGMKVQPATSRALEAYRDTIRLFESVTAFIQSRAAFGESAIIVAATGNESERTAANPYTIGLSPPAAAQGFIGVGAVGQGAGGAFGIANFSNAGATVVGPGVNIRSAKAGGGLRSLSGTSMATPHVAGVAALWAEKLMAPDGSVDIGVLRAQLVASGRAVPPLGSDDVGSGLVEAPQV